MATLEKIEGISVDQLLTQVTEKVTSKRDAIHLVANWLADIALGIARKFDYKDAFAPTDPACAPKFSRTFQHRDWRDGQDAVQAEQSTGEDGFNVRFHRIEADLDALGKDVFNAFSCLASMRSNLADRLDEIKAHINIINGDLARLEACCRGRRPPFEVGEVVTPGRFIGRTPFFGKAMNAFETEAGIVLLPTVEPVDGVVDPRVRGPAALAKALEESTKLQELFAAGEPVTKEKLLEEAGDLVIDEALTVRDVVDILPRDARFSTPEGLLKAVSEREAAAIRTSGFAGEVLTSALGVEVDSKPVSEAEVERLELVSSQVRTGLVAAGIGTVGELAKESPTELSERLENEGIKVTAGEAAELITRARILTLIR